MSPGTLEPFVVECVSPAAMREWAEFLADPNPIHLDVEAVKALGLGDRLINQGPANLAYVVNFLMRNFPGWTIARIDTRFSGNVLAGDRAVARGEVVEAGENALTCEAWLEVEGRGKLIACTARLTR